MIRAANLELVADALETAAGATTEANQNVTGQWLRIAEAAETLADVTNDLNDSVLGYMERTALAFESMTGTDGDAENPNYNGKLKRIVDALEDMNAEVGTGSLENRLVLAAQAFDGGGATRAAPISYYIEEQDGLTPPFLASEYKQSGTGAIDDGDFIRAEYSTVADFSTGVEEDLVAYDPVFMAFPTLAGLADGRWYSRIRVESSDATLETPGSIVSSWQGLTGDSFLFGDSVPGAWDFTNVSNAALSTLTESAAETPTGYTIPAAITDIDAGLEYDIDEADAWTDEEGELAPGESIRARLTSSGTNSDPVELGLSVGGVRVTFQVTTLAAPSAVGWTPETPPAAQNLGFGSNTATFTSINFGVGLGIVMGSSNARRASGVTVDGDPAVLVVQSGTGDNAAHCSMWQVAVASAGPKTVVFTGTDTFQHIAMSSGTLTNANATPTDTAVKAFGYTADPQVTTTDITVPTDGIGLAAAYCEANNNPTWGFGSEDADVGGSIRHTSAHLLASGTPRLGSEDGTTIPSGWAFSGSAMAAAAWEPA